MFQFMLLSYDVFANIQCSVFWRFVHGYFEFIYNTVDLLLLVAWYY